MDDRLGYWHPVLRERDLGRKPRGVSVCGVPIVLYRTSEGQIAALYDRCPHRRAPLSYGTIHARGLECWYHGCVFSCDGSGYCPTTRSTRFSVPTFETTVKNTVIWVRSSAIAARRNFDATAGLNPDLEPGQYFFTDVVEKTIEAPLQLVVDNMTELEHTGTVHKNLAFGIDDFDTVEHNVSRKGETIEIFYRGRQRPLPFYLKGMSGLRDADTYVQTATVSVTPPNASYVIDWSDKPDGTFRPFGLRFVIYYTPIDRHRTQLFAFIFWRADGRLRQLLMGASTPILTRVVSNEIGRDKEIIECLPQEEANLGYFQLNHFDRPLPMTRKLMAQHYPDPAREAAGEQETRSQKSRARAASA